MVLSSRKNEEIQSLSSLHRPACICGESCISTTQAVIFIEMIQLSYAYHDIATEGHPPVLEPRDKRRSQSDWMQKGSLCKGFQGALHAVLCQHLSAAHQLRSPALYKV
jgi:hypothetical protein